jgi:hypothetical protein
VASLRGVRYLGGMDSFSTTCTIDCTASTLWKVLTNPELMAAWMGPEMNITISTGWEVNAPILVKGFHHIPFENKGIVLRYEKEKALSYSHFSSISRLPDLPENYSILLFELLAVDNLQQLTIHISNFPTDVIRKHLEFYWRGTVFNIKKMAEAFNDTAQL